MLHKVVEVDLNVLRGAANSAHGVAKVAVVEQAVRVLLQGCELFWGTGAAAVIGLAIADSEILLAATDYSAKRDSCDYCGSQRYSLVLWGV